MDCAEKMLAEMEASIHSIFDPDPKTEDLIEKIQQIFRYYLPEICSDICDGLLTPTKN